MCSPNFVLLARLVGHTPPNSPLYTSLPPLPPFSTCPQNTAHVNDDFPTAFTAPCTPSALRACVCILYIDRFQFVTTHSFCTRRSAIGPGLTWGSSPPCWLLLRNTLISPFVSLPSSALDAYHPIQHKSEEEAARAMFIQPHLFSNSTTRKGETSTFAPQWSDDVTVYVAVGGKSSRPTHELRRLRRWYTCHRLCVCLNDSQNEDAITSIGTKHEYPHAPSIQEPIHHAMPYLGVLLLELLAQVVLLLLEHRSAGPREEGGAAGEHLERVGEVVALVDGDAPGCYVCVRKLHVRPHCFKEEPNVLNSTTGGKANSTHRRRACPRGGRGGT